MIIKNMIKATGVVSALLLAACTAQLGGVGRLSDGSPITGNFKADAASGANIITIASPAGWSCESVMTGNPGGA